MFPMSCARSKTGRHYRYLATREAIEDQQCLPGMQDEKQYPDHYNERSVWHSDEPGCEPAGCMSAVVKAKKCILQAESCQWWIWSGLVVDHAFRAQS